MTFKLPEVVNIRTELNGRKVRGSYSIILGSLTVYYKGDAIDGPKPEGEIRAPAVQSAAEEMLRNLVQEREAKQANIPKELPRPVQLAAKRYAHSFDDEVAVRKLVLSLGEPAIKSESYERIAYLLVNSLTPIVPAWADLCDDDIPIRIHGSLIAWLKERQHEIDWSLARTPAVARRDGVVIDDCDACRAEPLARAVARCADFMQTKDLSSAVETLSAAWGAAAEGCWPVGEERSYERWLVEEALPAAFRQETLDMN